MQPVKNKGVTYLLIAAVAVVWGIIIYRIFFTDPAEEAPAFIKSTQVHQPFDQYEQKPDTFKLALNYRDPFLGKLNATADTIRKDIHASVSIPKVVKPVAPPINWGIIKYIGYIVNPNTKKLVSILSVNGNERMIAEGESIEGVKLLKNKRDSVLVSWMGKQKYIKQ